jgi:hypothetical protein
LDPDYGKPVFYVWPEDDMLITNECQAEPPIGESPATIGGFCFLFDASQLLERASVHIHEDYQRPDFDFEEAKQILATIRAFMKGWGFTLNGRDTGAVAQGMLFCRLSVAHIDARAGSRPASE